MVSQKQSRGQHVAKERRCSYIYGYATGDISDISLDHGVLRLFCQPDKRLSGRRGGPEVSIRWRTPDNGEVPPDNFIPLERNNACIRAARQLSKRGLYQVLRVIAEGVANQA